MKNRSKQVLDYAVGHLHHDNGCAFESNLKLSLGIIVKLDESIGEEVCHRILYHRPNFDGKHQVSSQSRLDWSNPANASSDLISTKQGKWAQRSTEMPWKWQKLGFLLSNFRHPFNFFDGQCFKSFYSSSWSIIIDYVQNIFDLCSLPDRYGHTIFPDLHR